MKDLIKNIVNIINSLPFKEEVVSYGGEIYAVGGIVRDTIMGVDSDDLDIVIRNIEFNSLIKILKKYGSVVDTSGYENEGEGLRGSIKFVSTQDSYNKFLSDSGIQKTIDIMLPRKECKDKKSKGHKGVVSVVNHKFSIEDDLDRRDININAMAISQKGEIIDKENKGQNDIKNKKIRVVNSDVFLDDPLRMVRIIRQASKYNFDIDPDTVKLIRDNASLLSDKQELPKERFLMEFKKMIGKADLSRAVKMLVDFGMYKSIFGVEPGFIDYGKFSKAHNVGEFSYMMFEGEPGYSIVPLINKNITNDTYNLSFADTLVKYRELGISKMDASRINQLASLYKISPDAMTESTYINPSDKEIALKFKSSELPKNENELEFKGDEFKNFIAEKSSEKFGNFDPKRDGIKMGIAKKIALQAIYAGLIENGKDSIRGFLENKKEEWL